VTWSGRLSGPRSRLLTVALLTLQLGGCALDLTTEQAVLGSLFCLADPNDGPIELAGSLIWLVLSLSWVAGLAALRWSRLRPLYWSLVAATPLAYAVQAWLLHRHLLFCDAP
jgi:hypothetical protein